MKIKITLKDGTEIITESDTEDYKEMFVNLKKYKWAVIHHGNVIIDSSQLKKIDGFLQLECIRCGGRHFMYESEIKTGKCSCAMKGRKSYFKKV